MYNSGAYNSGSSIRPQELDFPPYGQPGMGHVPPMQQQPPMHHPQMQQPMQPQPIHTTNTNTTVVIQQQQQPQLVIQHPRDWSNGICSCFDDCGVCCLGWFCPGILQMRVSSNAGECCCVGAYCPIALRTKIRTRHNIEGSIVSDCCAISCCGPCAMCQMARELKIHGI